MNSLLRQLTVLARRKPAPPASSFHCRSAAVARKKTPRFELRTYIARRQAGALHERFRDHRETFESMGSRTWLRVRRDPEISWLVLTIRTARRRTFPSRRSARPGLAAARKASEENGIVTRLSRSYDRDGF